MRRLALAGGLVVALAGAASAQVPPPLPYPVVPAPRYEAVPPPPGVRYVWEPGHWHWAGRGYVWVGGRYVIRQPYYAHYVPGHWRWAPHRGGWVWQPAHWG